MKKLMILLSLCAVIGLNAAWINNQKVVQKDASGKLLHLFATGDEFYSRLHDKNDFTVVQSKTDGYYYYAVNKGDKIVPGVYKVNEVDPASVGLTPGAKISRQKYLERKDLFTVPSTRSSRAPSTGTVNNIVVFIRFNDQSEFTDPRSDFDELFNSPTDESMLSYYKEVSYDQLTLNSFMYPTSSDNTVVSYQDSYDRSYFQEYNAVTNPNGYSGHDERSGREQRLLKRAVQAIENQVPTDLVIDADDDGRVDNVCFVIRGDNDGWSDLLWAHRWMMYYEDVYIHGKRVWDYTFQPEPQVTLRTLCHEMFHSIGAPDLYRYNNQNSSPVGRWDIMEHGGGHMSAYMKYRYAGWIPEIPEISQSGQYTLNPLTSPTGNCFKIASPNSNQEYFVVEFRKRVAGTFEENVPGDGLIIYRVNGRADGEGNADGPPDELYAYRYNGTLTNDANPSQANFSLENGRTMFNDQTNPSAFLQGNGSGAGLGGITIANIGSALGDTITFMLAPSNGFVYGNVTTDLPNYDLSLVDIAILDQSFNVGVDGNYVFEHLQGTYDMTFSGPGLATKTVQATIEADQTIQVNVNLNYIPQVENLTYSVVNNVVTLNWDYPQPFADDFEEFQIWISLNNGAFRNFRQTTDLSYTLPFGMPLELSVQVVAKYQTGASLPSSPVSVDYATDANDANNVNKTKLMQNLPNPFNPSTLINYSVANKGKVNIEVYNILGQKVAKLVDEIKNPGQHHVEFKGKSDKGHDLPSGVYFYRLTTKSSKLTKKMLLLKWCHNPSSTEKRTPKKVAALSLLVTFFRGYFLFFVFC